MFSEAIAVSLAEVVGMDHANPSAQDGGIWKEAADRISKLGGVAEDRVESRDESAMSIFLALLPEKCWDETAGDDIEYDHEAALARLR